jgi:hypothetical protein
MLVLNWCYFQEVVTIAEQLMYLIMEWEFRYLPLLTVAAVEQLVEHSLLITLSSTAIT